MIANARSRTSMIGVMAMMALTVSSPADATTGQQGNGAAGWVSRPPLHIARIGAAATTIDGLIVVSGGFDTEQGSLVGRTEVRSTTGGGAWRLVAALPTPRTNAAAATFEGQAWVVGGYDEGDRRSPRSSATTRVRTPGRLDRLCPKAGLRPAQPSCTTCCTSSAVMSPRGPAKSSPPRQSRSTLAGIAGRRSRRFPPRATGFGWSPPATTCTPSAE
jgi:hypothetical protein